MEENVINTRDVTPGRTVLKLMGLEKKWVWHQGQWVDEKSIQVAPSGNVVEINDYEDDEPKSSWWKFWKK